MYVGVGEREVAKKIRPSGQGLSSACVELRRCVAEIRRAGQVELADREVCGCERKG